MRNQKEEFFELIYAQYAKKLERICLRYVNYQPEYREIAADSVQKTFLKALEEYDRLKDVSYIEPWLYQMLLEISRLSIRLSIIWMSMASAENTQRSQSGVN